MNNMIKIAVAIMIGMGVFLGMGCAKQRIWLSSPKLQSIVNPYYEAMFEPLSGGQNFFVWFKLTLFNKTGTNLEIDWNRSRYIHNERDLGGFVFIGINPEDIKNASIPPDIIPAGRTFNKMISPYKTLAYAPIRSRSYDQPGISPGILPEGINGILLVVRQGGKEIVEKITVKLKEEIVQ